MPEPARIVLTGADELATQTDATINVVQVMNPNALANVLFLLKAWIVLGLTVCQTVFWELRLGGFRWRVPDPHKRVQTIRTEA